MSECTHDCSTCSANCSSREQSKESMIEKLREGSKIGKVIAVVSGKGGVGKSLVTGLLAINAQRSGKKTCILDADITGPSIPKIFGVNSGVLSDGEAMLPPESKTGIKVMSLNLLLPNESDPVAWRGPIIAGCVKQFWTDVNWGENDVMYIDMPPGTGDVPLTVFQSLPVDGMIIVTSPQDLVSMIVGKAVRMAELMNIPILGLVENYSYFECPDCNKKHYIYGEGNVDAVAADHGIEKVAKLPIDPKLAQLCDKGELEFYEGTLLSELN
ncbi:MAG: Mrp/NBP35 family ATP-binding protein [Ruminococcaceae bacterium]|nr:Mrp/NBP35 family ATP-binding protein [Oscillospiraceae bacterium]